MDMKAEILKRVKLKVPNVIPENILVDIEDTILMVAEYTNRTVTYSDKSSASSSLVALE